MTKTSDGTSSDSGVAFVVEPLLAQRFAHAIGDRNRVYFDEASAQAAGLPGPVAPPTFVSSLQVWSVGAAESDLRVDGVDPARFPGPIRRDAALLGGGQELDFVRPVRLGERLTAKPTVVDHYERDTRAGPLTFVVVETLFTDEAGEAVLIARDTIVARQQQPAAAAEVQA